VVDQVVKKCFVASVVAGQERFMLRVVERGGGSVILVAVDITKPSRCEGFIWWLRPAAIRWPFDFQVTVLMSLRGLRWVSFAQCLQRFWLL